MWRAPPARRESQSERGREREWKIERAKHKGTEGERGMAREREGGTEREREGERAGCTPCPPSLVFQKTRPL